MMVSEYIADYLLSHGVDQGYFLTGGMVTFMADACEKKGLRLYTMHHEQAAAFAAEAQAAITRNVGFAMGTSGPGATNLITGIASAYFSSYPVLFITGQVHTEESNTTKERRQVGFQEADIVTMVSSITKYSKYVSDPNSIAYELERAMFTAKNGRMGPVLLDIPINVQRTEIFSDRMRHFIGSEEQMKLSKRPAIEASLLKKVAKELDESKRPVVLIGHGVKLANAESEVNRLIDISGMPFVTSLLGMDSVPNTDPRCYDFIGTYGKRYSNFALANADLILVLGARLDNRQIGGRPKEFAPNARIIHVDIDRAELGGSVKEFMSVEADIKEFVGALLQHLAKKQQRKEWIGYLDQLKSRYAKVEQKLSKDDIDPIDAMRALSEGYGEDGIITVDVGAHQMWFGQGWKVKRGQTVLIEGSLAPMGYSLPAAIGASLSRGKCPVLVVTGDGGLQINIQELQTIARNKLPIKIAVFDNNALGMITQFQNENFGGRTVGSNAKGGYNAPDFVKVANAYGLSAAYAKTKGELNSGIDWLMKERGPCLLDMKIPENYFTFPKSRFTTVVHDMFPLLDSEEFKSATRYANASK